MDLLVALGTSAGYGVMLTHQIDKALIFLDSASALIGVMSIAVAAWAAIRS